MSGELAAGPAKVCSRCRRQLLLTDFHRDPTHRDGRRSRCAQCENAAARKPGGYGPWSPVLADVEPRECPACQLVKPAAAFARQPGRRTRRRRCTACRLGTGQAARRAEAA